MGGKLNKITRYEGLKWQNKEFLVLNLGDKKWIVIVNYWWCLFDFR